MKRFIREISFSTLFVGSVAVAAPAQDAFVAPYTENCAVCHGETLEGTAQGPPLLGDLAHGNSTEDLQRSISRGFPGVGMPGFSDSLTGTDLRKVAIYVSEQRSKLAYTDFKVDAPLDIPDGTIEGEALDFRMETVATGLDPLPFSIAPLPDGSILLTEKTRGLSIVSPDGSQSELIRNTPQTFDDGFEAPGILLTYGTGWLLDVALHPDYDENGWVYLSYGDRCGGCNDMSRAMGAPVSMTRVIRGRIENGSWVDEETIWRTSVENYTFMPDMVAGGRLAFDGDGHLFVSIGMKGASNFAGVQDLGLPYGKILRLNDDGSIPDDNPFVDTPGALPEIWTYGHRSPQGLEFDRSTGRLWGTEMGPRGGDEVNLLVPGGNYGWPLYSKGMDYDGTPVEYGKDLGIEFGVEDIVQPVVDLTPSPAVSSFVFYDGGAFPEWQGDMIVGTLKATELYRMAVDGDAVMHREVLLSGFGRIRDIETATDGTILLLLENRAGSRIVRLVPAG